VKLWAQPNYVNPAGKRPWRRHFIPEKDTAAERRGYSAKREEFRFDQ
jgi:hypothetical protein